MSTQTPSSSEPEGSLEEDASSTELPRDIPWAACSPLLLWWQCWGRLLTKIVGAVSAGALAVVVLQAVRHHQALDPHLERDYLERVYGPDLRSAPAGTDQERTVREVDAVDMTKQPPSLTQLTKTPPHTATVRIDTLPFK